MVTSETKVKWKKLKNGLFEVNLETFRFRGGRSKSFRGNNKKSQKLIVSISDLKDTSSYRF